MLKHTCKDDKQIVQLIKGVFSGPHKLTLLKLLNLDINQK